MVLKHRDVYQFLLDFFIWEVTKGASCENTGGQLLCDRFGLAQIILNPLASTVGFLFAFHFFQMEKNCKSSSWQTCYNSHNPSLTWLHYKFLDCQMWSGSWCLHWWRYSELPTITGSASILSCCRSRRLDIFNLHLPSGYPGCKLLLWTAEYAGEVNITIMFFLIRRC